MDEMQQLQQTALKDIASADTTSSLNDLRVKYLGKKGAVQGLMKNMKNLPADEKPAYGQKVNKLKQELQKALEERKESLEAAELEGKTTSEEIDVTLPGRQGAFRRILRRTGTAGAGGSVCGPWLPGHRRS